MYRVLFYPKMLRADHKSDKNILISESGSESDFLESSDADIASEDNGAVQFREFVEVNVRNPAPSPPRFPYSNTAGVNLHFDDDAEASS